MGSTILTTGIQTAQIPVSLLNDLGINGAIYPSQTLLEDNSTHDYIVVGGGSAGAVVATRLVQDKKRSVLVLEAGITPPITALFAALFVALPKTDVDYDYMSTFDPFAAGGQGNYTTLTAGKMLGGCDSLNHLIHTRGCSCDFDGWANITDDTSWKYKNVLRYFIKSERLDDKEILSESSKYHGTDGPMGLTRELTDDVIKYLESFQEVGHPTVQDLNSDVFKGYAQSTFMIADGVRQTPAYSYIRLVKDNPNLFVSYDTRVNRVIFEGNVAVGVEAVYKGKTYTLNAKKGVILCAGVFGTPQVLMRSGIGPEDHLKEMGIEVKSNLPVGDNFIDQVATTILFKTKKYLLPVPNPLDLVGDVADPTKVPFPVLVGSVALNDSQTCADYQTFALFFAHDTPYLTLACRDTFWNREDICDRWQKKVAGSDSLYTVLTNLIPKSRGTVRLNSTDPYDDPVITTNYFTEREDIDNMIKFIKNFIQVGKSSFFEDVGAELVGMDLEECADKKAGSDDFWECYILNRAFSPYHYSSTCSMGKVVDGSLKVFGFENIRVVDASVMPTTPRGAPNAGVIMVAEKGADMIINDEN